jgi:hypothetical protein
MKSAVFESQERCGKSSAKKQPSAQQAAYGLPPLQSPSLAWGDQVLTPHLRRASRRPMMCVRPTLAANSFPAWFAVWKHSYIA